MANYVIIDNDTVVNVIEFDGNPADFKLPTGQTMVKNTGAGIGWTTTDGGQTFTAPVTPPPPAPTPQQLAEAAALKNAQATVTTLQSQQSAMTTQIQSDAALFAAMTPGEALTQEHIDAFGRMVNGFSTAMSAINAHMVITGAITAS